LKTNPDGAGSVQTIGPLKTLAAPGGSPAASTRRFLIVSELDDAAHVVLRQAATGNGGS